MTTDFDYHQLTILYEDNHLIAAVKPAGVLSQSDGSDSPDMLTSLKKYIKEKYNKPGDVWLGLVHRLDQPVSGVMVFAKTSKAASRLSEQIRSHQVGKFYLAAVSGEKIPESGELMDILTKDRKSGQVSVRSAEIKSAANDKYAVLEFKKLAVVETDQGMISLLMIKPGTGRGHQIRVQLASRGWPILGDARYGGNLNYIHKTKDTNGRWHADLALFSCRLEFNHPVKKDQIVLTIKPPAELPWSLFANLHS
jgi:23S rRNA pseudouridine1911/1915/1917 synthase